MERARILIVEDEELVALAIKTFLDGAGHLETFIAASGEEAIQAIPTAAPDLILMDIHLQGEMTGIEAARIIKDSYHLPIVYLTAYSDAKTLEEARATEPFGYILKPFDERSLQATIEMALYKASMQEQLRQAKENMETILRSVGEGVIVTGSSGIVDYMNSNAMKLLGRSAAPSDTTSIFSLCTVLNGRTGEPVSLHLDEVMIEGKSVALTDCVIVTPEGKRFSADIDLAPFRGDRGTPRGMVMTFRDVTERRTIPELISLELQNVVSTHQSLLPLDGTIIDGYQLHGFMLTAAFGGGDLYNFFRIDEEHAGIYIIDVMGHGIAASSLAMLLSRLLVPNAESGEKLSILDADPCKPGAVVERLNDLFFSSGLLFFTICYGVIDTAKGSLLMARAGHPKPILVNSEGGQREIEGGGNAIGLGRHMSYAEFSLSLGQDERLYLYTDGLTECSNDNSEPFTSERLRDLLSSTAREDPLASVATIKNAVNKWKGAGSYDDDITLIVLHRAAPSAG